MSSICFVIQPFDHKFDKRFEDIFRPSIIKAGFEAYRVDRDPSVAIPIDTIESGIKASAACLVDITTDNPNVWCELGIAIAFNKPLCLVCSKERVSKFPFDVQHRTIISYSNDSKSDYESLAAAIAERLEAIRKLEVARKHLPSSPIVNDSDGLQPHEVACIAVIAAEVEGIDGSIGNWLVKSSMENAGFNRMATQVALHALAEYGFLSISTDSDQDGNRFEIYRLTSSGWNWIRKNVSKFSLTPNSNLAKQQSATREEELPF